MGEWISVKDRLPEVWQKVIVAIRVNGDSIVDTGWWLEDGRTVVSLGFIQNHITHWMPLPEPPKEG